MTGVSIDLNADLGEGGPADSELLDLVTSASIACGVHAGSPATMLSTAAAAVARGVSIGAHPSYDDREGFGRRPMEVDPEELFATVLGQVEAMATAAQSAGSALRFVKPHGALYHQATVDPAVAEVVVRVAAASSLPILCPPGSQMEKVAAVRGIRTYAEAFADRAYRLDGTLVRRSDAGAVLHDPEEVAARAVALATTGRVTMVDGMPIEVPSDSICVHGDHPAALDLVRAVRRALTAAGVEVRPFATASS